MGGHRVTGVISARVLTATAPHVAEQITTTGESTAEAGLGAMEP